MGVTVNCIDLASASVTINWKTPSVITWADGVSHITTDGNGNIYVVGASRLQYGNRIVQPIYQLIPTSTKLEYDGYLFCLATVTLDSIITSILAAYGYLYFTVALSYSLTGNSLTDDNNYIAQYYVSTTDPLNTSGSSTGNGIYKFLLNNTTSNFQTNIVDNPYGLIAYQATGVNAVFDNSIFVSMYTPSTILVLNEDLSNGFVNLSAILILDSPIYPGLDLAAVGGSQGANTYSIVDSPTSMISFNDVLYVVTNNGTNNSIQTVYLPTRNTMVVWAEQYESQDSTTTAGWEGNNYPIAPLTYQQAAGAFITPTLANESNLGKYIFGNQIACDSVGNLYVAARVSIKMYNATYTTQNWSDYGPQSEKSGLKPIPIADISFTSGPVTDITGETMCIAYDSTQDIMFYATNQSIGSSLYPILPYDPIFGEIYPVNSNNLVSNICFVANTPITTNQGNIEISKINPKIHTIGGKKIVAITKTTSLDTFLVCIEKDALGVNLPSQKTIISKDHFILYEGKAVKAKKLLGLNEKIYKIKYNGEILFNVLMEDYDKMVVNNLICETLHPKNLVAQIYKQFPELKLEEQERLIKKVNEAIKKEEMKRKNIEKKQNHLKLAIL